MPDSGRQTRPVPSSGDERHRRGAAAASLPLCPARTRPPWPASLQNGGATASLPSCPARTRPPWPTHLQKLKGQRPRCPHATRAKGRRAGGSPKLEGQRPRCPFAPRTQGRRAGGSPKLEGQRPRCPFTPRASGRRGRRISKNWRGNSLVALLPRAHQAAAPAALHKNWRGNGLVALMPAQTSGRRGRRSPKLEGQRPRCPFTPRASGRRGRRISKNWRGNSLVALMRRAQKAAAPAALQNWRGNGLVALLPRAHQAAVADASPKTGGATASLPFYPAQISPPGPTSLRNDFHTNHGRGNGLVALLPRAHQAAVADASPKTGGATA